MATLRIRDPYGREFDIDATARPFWEGREGYTILEDSDEPTSDPAPEPAPQDKPAVPADTAKTRSKTDKIEEK